MKILIVEDEKHLADGLKFNLEAEGYTPAIAGDGEAALLRLAAESFDAVVLDVMLPGIDGFDVARALRMRGDYTPILMLTARDRPEDVLQGLDAGADDYLAKPFDLAIFLARLAGLLRRQRWFRDDVKTSAVVVEINGRTIDFENLELRHAETVEQLTLLEAKLLRFLVDNPGRAVSRKIILDQVWELQADTDTRAIDNFIVRLRRYIEDEPNTPRFLRTVRGVGYRFEPAG